MRAKKSYGQHFLTNEEIAARIADSLIHTNLYEKVLEIGPGKGMLTKYLIEKPYKLAVVEADWDMVEYLNKHFPQLGTQIIPDDFLKTDLSTLFQEASFAIIGNFPYNISSQILFKMLDHKDIVPELVGMFQKEVAERICAPHGSKVYGVISVLIQAYYEAEYLFTVDRINFNPPPKVQSAVIRLTRKADLEIDCDPKRFRIIVKQAFSQRRKMLRNTMKTFIKGHPILEDEFFRLRPEQLSVADFIQLTNKIEEAINTMK